MPAAPLRLAVTLALPVLPSHAVEGGLGAYQLGSRGSMSGYVPPPGQYLAVEKTLELDRDRVNVNGGAIALGHPLGATGTRLLLTLVREMEESGKALGCASACIGGGQGIAMILERA